MTSRSHVNHAICFLTILCLVLSPLCLSPSPAMALSIDEETVLGQKFLAEIRKQYELLDNDYANAFFNDLGQYILTSLKTKPFPFHFYIIKDNTLNAFSAPGGLIFFYSGLIEHMDSCDMLAGVMGHEIGHSAARHLSQSIEQNKKIGLATIAGVLAGVLIGGGAASSALITGSMAAGIQTQLHYSREDESQADQLGFRYSTEAGFSPSGLIDALKAIEQASMSDENSTPPYLLTHPAPPERMADLDSMASGYKPGPPKKEAMHFRALFPIFKTVVEATCLDSSDAERIFKNALKKDPNDPIAQLGLGIVYQGQLEYGEAVSHLKKALEKMPDSVLILRTLGRTYQLMGKDTEAIEVLKKALALKDEDPSSLFTLALSYENLGAYQEAINLLKRLASINPGRNEVYYHLGISYGRQNKLALAHYNFGLYFKALGEVKKAHFHFQKAKELAQNDMDLLKKIRTAMEPEHHKAL
jgi:predicted Zn-dependent protease